MSGNAARLTTVPLTSSRERNRRRRRNGPGFWSGMILIAAACAVTPSKVEAQEYGPLGAPGHWCTFNRACNWTAHAGIAFGTTYALNKVHVPLPIAAGAGAALFVGKEVRDHMKWGDFWTFDSLVDLGTGVAGAGLAYWLLRPDEPTGAAPYLGEDGQLGLSLNLAF